MIYDLQGRRYSLSSATIDFFNGYRMLGAAELKLNEKVEPGEVEGTSPIPVGNTTGPWSGTGGFKAPMKEVLDGMASMGGNICGQIITASWSFTEFQGDGSSTISILSARLTTVDLDGGDRSKASMIAVEFKLLEPCEWDGVKIIDVPGPTTGLASFALSITI